MSAQVQHQAPTGAAGIAFMTPAGELLFLKRGGDGDHPGEWCFPAGKIEDGETPEQAAAREALEEVGSFPDGKLILLDHAKNADGIDFTTFKQDIPAPFIPTLNDEHSDFVWAPLEKPPQPLHPGIRTLLEADFTTDWSKQAHDAALAFDRASVRTYDRDGRLHVAASNISKAVVNPYLGREIPGFEALGLQPDKIYNLFRDPAELAKAAPSFNNLPILNKHVPVTAMDHQPDLVVGSTGTDAAFVAPYLRNSLVIWAQASIAAVESEVKNELSSAYRYRADMTPGTHEGQAFDGVMRDLVGNHVALVKDGRAGADVVVGDAAIPTNLQEMIMTKPVPMTRKAALVQGALLLALRPKIAQDAKIDFDALLAGVTAKNFGDKKVGILAGLKTQLTGKLAQDASIDDVAKLLDSLQDVQPQEGADADPAAVVPPPVVAKPDAAALPPPAKVDDKTMDADPVAKIKAFLATKGVAPEILAELDTVMAADADPVDEKGPAAPPFGKGKPAQDKDPDMKPDMVTKPAMDAAINAAVKLAHDNDLAARAAERDVRPLVGELAMAHDSAEAVYKTAFGMLNVDVTGVHPSAYPTILRLHKDAAGSKKTPAIAQDAAMVKSYAERFPGAGRIGTV